MVEVVRRKQHHVVAGVTQTKQDIGEGLVGSRGNHNLVLPRGEGALAWREGASRKL